MNDGGPLLVVHVETNTIQGPWRDDGRMAWRVAVVCSNDGVTRTLPMPFGRSQDAEAAMRAIADLYDWTLPAEELVASFDFKELRRAMVEAMAW